MTTDWELNDWFLNAGERAERKRIALGTESLSAYERLLLEVWLLDLETENGGVSQYFCNRGLDQWRILQSVWIVDKVPSLGPIITEIERVIASEFDPYLATLDASPGIEDFYDTHQPCVLAELRALEASETVSKTGI